MPKGFPKNMAWLKGSVKESRNFEERPDVIPKIKVGTKINQKIVTQTYTTILFYRLEKTFMFRKTIIDFAKFEKES